MKSINKEDFEDDNYIKELSLKARVMKNIKPLLYKNRNIKKRERKNKIQMYLIDVFEYLVYLISLYS